MIKFTIVSDAVRENKGLAKATQKPYHMHMQTAYAHTYDRAGALNPFPEKMDIILEVDEVTKQPKVFPPGEYQMHPSSIYMGKYGLEVAPLLLPIKKS